MKVRKEEPGQSVAPGAEEEEEKGAAVETNHEFETCKYVVKLT